MIDIETIIGSKVSTSFNVAGLYVPANSLSQHLQSFTAPGLFHTEGFGEYHLSKSGSLLKIRILGRYYCLVSAHQVLGRNAAYDHDQICLHNPDTSRIITSHRVIYPQEDADFNYDILLYEFTESVASGKLPKSGWLSLEMDTFTKGNPKPSKVLCIGYPGYKNSFDYAAKKYAAAPVAVWGNECLPDISDRLAFSPDPEIRYDPAGMSGAPVFGIHLPNLTPEFFFAGVLTNASKTKFHFLSRYRIASIIESALDPEN